MPLDDHLEFPVIFTYKIVGDNTPEFISAVDGIFCAYEDCVSVPKESSEAKYISLSVTVEVKDFEELKSTYEKISRLNGLRFYV